MTPFEKLDNVLGLLSTTNYAEIEHNVPIARLDIDEIINFLERELIKPMTLTVREVTLILTKLEKDGYVHIQRRIENVIGLDNNVDRWFISYEGYVFIQQGGYTGEISRKNFENVRLEKMEHRQNLFQRTLNLLTLLIAFGTLVAAFYYGQQIWLFYHPASH